MKQQVDFFLTINQNTKAEYKDRGSKFIAYAYPVITIEECKQYLAELKKAHPKAVHYCFAYRLGLEGNVFRANDDGEPSGTAGKPILGQIDSKQLTNILIVVVRYFGGTLLGTSGLINAYKTTAALALQTTPIVQKPILIVHDFHFDYTKMNDIMSIVKKYDCTIIKQEIQLFCFLSIGISKARKEEVLYQINEVIN